MKTDLQKHLYGIYTVLKARIELINASIGHSLTQGEETEREIISLLTDFLPSSYGIGSGIIIDIDGKPSKQIDIIIYDNSKPNYTLSRNSKIFLVDQVIAAIEIKTNYEKLKEGLENIKSVKELKTAKGQKAYQDANPPLGILFLFKANDTQSAINIDNKFKNLKKSIDLQSVEHQPDLVFSLDHASSFQYNDIFLRDEQKQEYSVFVLQGYSDKHSLIWFSGLDDKTKINSKTKAVFDDSETTFLDNIFLENWNCVNSKKTSEIRILRGDKFNLNPIIYRVAKINKRYYLLDKFRAFLIFIWQIDLMIPTRLNAEKSWSISDYFSEDFTKSAKYPDAFSKNQN